MVFSSLQFVLVFLPIFFTVYFIVPAKLKNEILFLGSLLFYFIGTRDTPHYFILFVVSIVMDFYLGLGMERYEKHKKMLLAMGVIFHLSCLGIFKYAGFLMGELGIEIDIILPIGISFYTFQGISYLVDVYRKTTNAEKRLLNYVVYISMFEQLIAGPIVTYGQVKKRLNKRMIFPWIAIRGIEIFIFGLGLKVLLANPLGKLWAQIEAIGFESISTPLAWIAIAAYSFQIYFDFFGYSLMAIGIGKMLGFRLPRNFNHPYTARTMTEFWRRWHITLGTWFREYVYIPLGGNRAGKIKTIRNLWIVWLLTGIWHGAGYHFILWGCFLFCLIFLEKKYFGTYFNTHPFAGHLYMMLVIPCSWAIFAISDWNQLKIFFGRLFPFFGQGIWSVFQYDYLKYLEQYYPFLIAGILFSTKLPYRMCRRLKNHVIIAILMFGILFASLYCMYQGFDDPFLYFRF